VRNAERTAAALEQDAKQSEALFRVDRVTRIDKLRADQGALRAKNNLIDEQQAYKLALDRFKVSTLGVPTTIDLDVPDDVMPAFVPVDFSLESGVRAALANRLDLSTARDQLEDSERNSRVAENALLPDLSLTGSYGINSDGKQDFSHLSFKDESYGAGIRLDLPLDRKAERNAYRASLIQIARARRALERQEDEVILAVRNGLRQVRQQAQQIEIQRAIIETETARVQIAEIRYRAGEIGSRDLTEARENQLAAQNALIQNVVAFEISRLSLLREVGILFVREDGAIVE
jgi:outer membrane protein TolC